jgi:hypothetical protein
VLAAVRTLRTAARVPCRSGRNGWVDALGEQV